MTRVLGYRATLRFLGEVGRWLLGRHGRWALSPWVGACSVRPWWPYGQRPPIEPCMRFSRTRLSDTVHREACGDQ